MKINSQVVLFFLAVVFFSNPLYGQHPSMYLTDIYNLEWCQSNNVKSIESMGNKYHLKHGIMIEERASDITVKNEGEIIRYTYGNGTFKMAAYLTPDFKRLRETKMGDKVTSFHYDENNLLTHKVSTANANSQAPKGAMLEELQRDSEGIIIAKLIYDYNESLSKYKTDLKKLRSMDRKLRELWDYKYDKDGNLELITIKRFINGTDQIESTFLIKISHENDLPISMKIELLEEGTFKFKKNRKFKYSF